MMRRIILLAVLLIGGTGLTVGEASGSEIPAGARVGPMPMLCRFPAGVAPPRTATLAQVEALCASKGTKPQ
jgi:hypothetical protein